MSLRPGRSSRSLLAFALSAALFAMPAPGGAPPLDGSFTYQGRLMEAGEPANGSFDFQFSLWQDASAGTQTGSTIAVDGLAVTDGLVQANLDFGVGFTSSRRWLEVAVRPAGSPDPYTTLAPRRELVATPQATFAVDAADAANAALLDGIDSLGFATAAHAHSSIQTSSGNSSVVLSDIGRYLVGGTNNAATAANAGAIGGANNAAGGSNSATVGGDSLTASGVNAVAIGGFENAATGQHSIALGGADNGANGDYSLAGGRGSVVSGDGTFAWADSTNASFNSTIDNAFLIRAANGVGINTTTPGAKLHVAGTAGADGIMFPDGTLQTTAFTGGMAGNSLDAADGSPTEAVYVDNDGRVGIGTLAPSAGLHVASSSSGDASMPELLATLIDGAGGFDGLNGPRSMLVSGNRLYVASSADNAMSILDISDPAAPVQLGSVVDGVGGFTRLAGANSVAVSGNTAFVAATTDNALTIIDVANPAAPLLLAELVDGAGGFNRLAGALFVAVSGTTAIVAAGTPDHALTLIDVSNPAAPTLLAELVDGQGGFNRLQGANVVRISGTTAYASAQNDDALTLIDISNPASPALLAEIVDGVGGFARLDGCNHVFVDGTIAYATASIDDALTIVDVSNPASPALLATVVNGSGAVDNMSGPLAVAAADGVAYVAAATSDAVTILDVSNPSSPFLLGELVDGVDGLDRLQGARHVAVSGSNVFVAAFTDDAITVLRRGSLSAFFEDGVSIGGSLSVAEGATVQGGLGVGGPAPAAGLDVEGGDLELSGNYLLLSNNGDAFDGLGVRRGVNPFAGLNVGGPVLWGEGGGALGSNDQVDGEAIALRWLDSGNVGIGLANPTAKLHVGGTAGSDGIRFPDGTLQTTAFTGGGVATPTRSTASTRWASRPPRTRTAPSRTAHPA
jgi:hypothetical protein